MLLPWILTAGDGASATSMTNTPKSKPSTTQFWIFTPAAASTRMPTIGPEGWYSLIAQSTSEPQGRAGFRLQVRVAGTHVPLVVAGSSSTPGVAGVSLWPLQLRWTPSPSDSGDVRTTSWLKTHVLPPAVSAGAGHAAAEDRSPTRNTMIASGATATRFHAVMISPS